MNLWLIITVIHITKAVVKLKPEKKSGFNFTTAQVVCITAMINHKFILANAIMWTEDIAYTSTGS